MLRRHLKHCTPMQKPADAGVPQDKIDCLKTAVADARNIQLILGAGKTRYPGWISTNRHEIDVVKSQDWNRMLGGRRVDRLLAEHVWEHLSFDEMKIANQLAFEHLMPGGCLRIAVPDGFHPDPEYVAHVKPGGIGPAADEHQQLLNQQLLTTALEEAGFRAILVEYWDEQGCFHHRPWRSEDGHVKRSLLHDRRNRHGRARYTSLIIDAIKPAK